MSEVPGIDLLSTVKIRQTDKSAGFRTRRGYKHTFPAGPNVKSYFDISFPYEVDMMGGDYYTPAGSNESRAWVEIMPNLNLAFIVPGAALQNAVAPTDTFITLNAQALGAASYYLNGDGVSQKNEVYFRLTSVPGDPTDFTDLRVATFDAANSKLTSPTGSALGLTASAGDPIFLTTRWEDGTFLAPGEYVRIGDETIGSSAVPPGVVLRFIVENANATDLILGFNITYLHS